MCPVCTRTNPPSAYKCQDTFCTGAWSRQLSRFFQGDGFAGAQRAPPVTVPSVSSGQTRVDSASFSSTATPDNHGVTLGQPGSVHDHTDLRSPTRTAMNTLEVSSSSTLLPIRPVVPKRRKPSPPVARFRPSPPPVEMVYTVSSHSQDPSPRATRTPFVPFPPRRVEAETQTD